MELPKPFEMQQVARSAQQAALEEERRRERVARERGQLLEDRSLELLFAEMAIRIRHAAEDGYEALDVYTTSDRDWNGLNRHQSALIGSGQKVFVYFTTAGYRVSVAQGSGGTSDKITISWKSPLPEDVS